MEVLGTIDVVKSIIQRSMDKYESVKSFKPQCKAYRDMLWALFDILEDIEHQLKSNSSVQGNTSLKRPLILLRDAVEMGANVLDKCSKKNRLMVLVFSQEYIGRLQNSKASIAEALSILPASGVCLQAGIKQDIRELQQLINDLDGHLAYCHHDVANILKFEFEQGGADIADRIIKELTIRGVVANKDDFQHQLKKLKQEQSEFQASKLVYDQNLINNVLALSHRDGASSVSADDMLDCGIMNSLLEDPVILIENGKVYDRKNLCKWLMENPRKDPIGKEYDTPLSYCDAVPIRKYLMEKHGDSAYRRFDDASFKREYLKVWEEKNLRDQSTNDFNRRDESEDDETLHPGRSRRTVAPQSSSTLRTQSLDGASYPISNSTLLIQTTDGTNQEDESDNDRIFQLGRSKSIMVPTSNSTLLTQSTDGTNQEDECDNDKICSMVQLKDLGYTDGLIKSITQSNLEFPLRIWIVDNSGSMMKADGHRIVHSKQKNVRCVPCTRWSEIQDTVEHHAKMAALLEAPTVFRLLNDPGRKAGPQQFSIGERGQAFIADELDVALNTIKKVSPSGVTPLSDHIREIKANVEAMREELVQRGQKVVIVLATDGLPSNAHGVADSKSIKEFKKCLRSLEGLPVWIVIRLCTDEEDVVAFYNYLDSHLELSFDVIDDFKEEAKEVYEFNSWLNYALPLHRMREMGFNHKLFDLLDERPLTKDELKEFFLLIFGPDKLNGLPDPQTDWKGFVKHINRTTKKNEKKHWNPMKEVVAPWVDVKKLKSHYGDNFRTTIPYLFKNLGNALVKA